MNRRQVTKAIFTAAVCATCDIDAAIGKPRWRLTQNAAERTFTLTVDASGLARNEDVTKASCRIRYLDQNGTELGERAYDVEVSISGGTTKTRTVRFEIERAVGVRGQVMDWEVDVRGENLLPLEGNTKLRGSSPPEEG